MMTQRQLSNQSELVHQLDTEPVIDYLLQHRQLNQSTVDVIRDEEKLADRNIKLLQHLEELGNPAVELFINALRQSGQMHLASTLDVEHRIKPVQGQGYWEKQRYKGQITISFQLVAAKVMVRKDSEEDKSPKIDDINAMLTPFKVKHSYENMTLLGEEDGDEPRARKILEYSYQEEDKRPCCCWCCCCLPFFCCSKKTKHKKKGSGSVKSAIAMETIQPGAPIQRRSSNTSLSLYDVMVSLPAQPSSPIKSGSTFFKTKKLSPTVEVSSDLDTPSNDSAFVRTDSSVDTNSNSHLNEAPLTQSDSNTKQNNSGVRKGKYSKEESSAPKLKSDKKSGGNKGKMSKDDTSCSVEKSKNKKNGKKRTKSDSTLETKPNGQVGLSEDLQNGRNFENKENSDPVIWDVHKTKSSKDNQRSSPPASLNTKLSTSSGMKRSETYELVERWKSEGRAYQTTRDQFFSFFDSAVQGRIVRYFEQERSTLVLHVKAEDKMSVCTICMTMREVRKLREDYEKGVLHDELVRCVDPQTVIDKMECCAVHLRTVIDEEDFTLSCQELS